ncbi:MAG: hypothetical protein JW947_04695 [Sedimentisphaerales bacterium]|nr:hypothetical protein [Sedimentisphaerales bacterium]
MAQSPEAWRRTAIGLKRSADIIWEQWFGVFSRLEGGQKAKCTTQELGDLYLLLPSFLLLSGLAIENALKGLLISKEPSIVESKIKWKVGLGGHDLGDLFKRSGFIPTSDEQEFLNALTQAILWTGRYPVPKEHANKLEFGIPLGPFFRNLDISSVVSRMSELKKTYDNLYSLALSEYPKLNSDET